MFQVFDVNAVWSVILKGKYSQWSLRNAYIYMCVCVYTYIYI